MFQFLRRNVLWILGSCLPRKYPFPHLAGGPRRFYEAICVRNRRQLGHGYRWAKVHDLPQPLRYLFCSRSPYRAVARILSPVHRIWGFPLGTEAATHCATRHISHNRSRKMEQLPLGTQWQNYFASKPFGYFSSALTVYCTVLNAFSPMFRYL